MLHIIQSNRLESLSHTLGEFFIQSPLNSLFSQDKVLVQSPGMAQWLKIQLSQQLGVVAQVDFPLPSSFIWKLYQTLLPEVPEESAFNKMNLTWKLYDILPEYLQQEGRYSHLHSEFSALVRYLSEDQDGSKRFSLCEKIADAYDQYLMYRPDWIAQWESGENELDDVDCSDCLWQPILWRALIETTAARGQSPYHRGNLHQALLDAIEKAPSAQLPDRLVLFAITSIPPGQLEIFHALAQRIPVYLYWFSPSEHYWGDLVDEKTLAKIEARYSLKPNIDAHMAEQHKQYYCIGNPLLASWGKLGRDYLEALIAVEPQWHDAFEEGSAEHLLSHIQQEIFQLSFKGESLAEDNDWFANYQQRTEIERDDSSFVFKSCHTPLREVEALKNHLLALFESNPGLTPNDIIVMMPDVGVYSPLIQAVFASEDSRDPQRIPYALSDLSIDQEDPILNSFLQLASLPFSRFGLSELMDLLHVDAIRQQFEIAESELEQVQFWLEQVGVKWAIDGAHKSHWQLPEHELNTWTHGLKRLLMGSAVNHEHQLVQVAGNAIYPSDQVEGMAMVLLGKVLAFFNLLSEFQQLLAMDATLEQKATALKQLTASFYHPDAYQSSERQYALQQVTGMIDNLHKHQSNGDYSGLVAQKVIVKLIQQGIRESGVGQRFLAGQVNFCTLMPMRSVPFQVICMLGMNDADYPRQVQQTGFDLLPKGRARKGDRSRKHDDRYLFLEALLSARQQVYISFIGRSCIDNSEKLPSTLVSELFEYIDRGYCFTEQSSEPLAAKDTTKQTHLAFLTQEALQPFDPLYFNDNSSNPLEQSFDPLWMPKAGKPQTMPEPLQAELEPELEFERFVRHILRPHQQFYRHRLGVVLPEFEQQERDEEPFILNQLDRYALLQEWLATELNQQQPDIEHFLQRGHAPLAVMGELAISEVESTQRPLLAQLKALDYQPIQQEAPELSISLSSEQHHYQLLGWYEHLSQRNQVFFRPAKIKGKDLIRSYLYHLAACAQQTDYHTYVLGLDECYQFDKLSVDQALQALTQWFEFYRLSLTRPVAFFPEASWEYAKTENLVKAQQKFKPEHAFAGGFSESNDPYIRLNFKTLNSVEAEFIHYAEQLLIPLRENMQPLSREPSEQYQGGAQ